MRRLMFRRVLCAVTAAVLLWLAYRTASSVPLVGAVLAVAGMLTQRN